VTVRLADGASQHGLVSEVLSAQIDDRTVKLTIYG
jgi:hypothetical protein